MRYLIDDREDVLVAIAIQRREDREVWMQMLSWASLRVAEMCVSVILGALFGLHTWLTKFLEFAWILPDSRGAIFYHLQNLQALETHMSRSSLERKILPVNAI